MFVIFMLAAYLLGSIPFGFLIAKIWNIDIRKYGSGNIGSTNVFRTLGPLPGTIAFALDFFKGMLAVYMGFWVGGDPLLVILMGVSVVFGHMFSIFLGFKGGKGAATGLGVLAGIAPDVFLVAVIVAAVVIAATRFVSLASILTALTVAALMFILHKPLPYALATFLVAVFILIRHIPNIRRLLNGTELRL